jgi:hypothetical protein
MIDAIKHSAADYLAGSCMLSMEQALSSAAEILGHTDPITDEDMEEFREFVERIEMYQCESCGWWTYPGEFCDCEDECYECGQRVDECECEDE